MTLEVASQLFELYLSLADIQRFWSSILGRCVSCPIQFSLPPPPVPLPHPPYPRFSSLTRCPPPRVF